MLAPQVLSAGIEASLNKALQWSSNSDALLSPLAGKLCIIYIQELDTALRFSFFEHEVNVGVDSDKLYSNAPEDDEPNALQDNECWVSISLFAIDKLKQNNQMTKLIKSGKLDFAGDLGILQGLSRLFDKIDVDIEELLSTYLGDAAAYQVNKTGQQALASIKSQMSILVQTLADTALDEKPIALRPIALVNFSDEVNQLREDVDRFEAKLQKIEEKTNKGKAQ